MFKQLFLRTLFLTLTAVQTAFAGVEVVLQESFEVPDTENFITYSQGNEIITATNRWAVVATGVDLFEDPARSEATAFDGAQAVDLAGSPGAGVIETELATTPGKQYLLEFHYARNNNIGGTIAEAQVDVIGTTTRLSQVVAHNPAMLAFNTYQAINLTFTADSPQTKLRFTSRNSGAAGVILDAISITTEPEPPSVAVPTIPVAAWIAPVIMALLGARLSHRFKRQR